jgi:hypothetical protein
MLVCTLFSGLVVIAIAFGAPAAAAVFGTAAFSLIGY